MSFPRGLLAAFVALVLLPAAMLVALGVQILRQDRDLEERRRHELAAAAHQQFVLQTLQNGAVGALLFVPDPPVLPEPPIEPFAESDRLEFRVSQPAEALALNTKLADHSDSGIRAGALLRVGRLQRRQGNIRAAVEAWSHLARIDSIGIASEPAALFARRAVCRTLQERNETGPLRVKAQELLTDLYAGRFPIDRDTFLIASEQAQQWLGRPFAPPQAELARAEAYGVLTKRKSGPEGALCQGEFGYLWNENRAALIRLPGFLACSASNQLIPVLSSEPIPEFAGRRRALAAALVTLLIFISAAALFAYRAINRELRAARLQSDFVSAVSHEFRTPLTALRQFNEMLSEDLTLAPTVRQSYYAAQSRATGRLSRLVETLLDFGRMEAGRRPYVLQPLDASQLLRDVTTEFANEPTARGFELDTHIPDEPLPIDADRDAMWRALWNLIDNAVKYSGESRRIEIDAMRSGGKIAIQVTDHGLGIAAADQPKLFQKFVRTDGARKAGIPGTGIGLAMVRHIAVAHRGNITLTSQESQGSTFILTLPERKDDAKDSDR